MSNDTAAIGVNSPSSEAISIRYLSDYNIAELDYVFWNSDSFVAEFSDEISSHYQAYHNPASVLGDVIEKRTEELINFAKNGGNVVIFTGKNADRKYSKTSFYNYTILRLLHPQTKSGRKKDKLKTEKLDTIISNIYKEFSYNCIIRSKEFTPLIKVSRTNDCISSYFLTDNGGIILSLPLPENPSTSLESIKILIAEIKSSEETKEETTLPTWTNQYQLLVEKEKLIENDILREKISSLNEEIKKNEEIVSQNREWKHLFSSHDKTLEYTAIKAFKKIGFIVVEGPETHCDIICIKGNTILAVEAKGLVRNTKPTNISQCGRWMKDIICVLDQDLDERDPTTQKYAACLEKLGVNFPTSSDSWEVKGVVLINTFRDTNLEDRDNPSEPSFNKQVTDRMKRENMCGMTGIQLFNLAIQVQHDHTLLDTISDNILNSIGELSTDSHWETYLSKEV